MKNFKIITLLLVLALALSLIGCSKKSANESFGKAIPEGAKVISMTEIFNNPSVYEGKDIVVTGSSSQICQASGCWVVIQDSSLQLFVQFYDFTYRPKVGTELKIQGTLLIQNGVPYLAATGMEIIK